MDALAEGSGDLYAGDTLLPHQTPTPGLHFAYGPGGAVGPRWPSLPPFLDSVRRLRALEGARRTLQGHGTPGANPARLAARFEQQHPRRRVCRQPVGQQTPRRARPDDDVVVVSRRRTHCLGMPASLTRLPAITGELAGPHW